MGEVYNIKPKPKAFDTTYRGQNCHISFDPNASKHMQWVWEVSYVVTHKHYGTSDTMSGAINQARRRIALLDKRKLNDDERQDGE